ncbi:MAG: zincin-like metallopeptidase domain-containing protein [Rhizomicrobium sp.]
MHQTDQQSSSGSRRANLYQDVTDRIICELEQGSVPWVQPWSAASAPLGMPRSAASRKFYSGINVLILWDTVIRHGYAHQEWLTFRQALSLGGHVRKGERGTAICYADRFIPKKEQERARESGDAPTAVPFLKRFVVFNVEQCDGLPPHIVAAPEPVAPSELSPDAETLIAATGAKLVESGGEAFYHRGEDFIRLPHRETFLSPADYYCTALHELGHWTAHPARLNRDLQHRFGSSAYAREELIAELTSAFLCAHLNIVPQIRHADYLGHWLKILKEDSRAIFHASSQASKATDFILAFQQPREAEIPTAEAAE